MIVVGVADVHHAEPAMLMVPSSFANFPFFWIKGLATIEASKFAVAGEQSRYTSELSEFPLLCSKRFSVGAEPIPVWIVRCHVCQKPNDTAQQPGPLERQ